MNPFMGGAAAMLQNQLAQGQKPAPQMNYEEWKASSGQAGDRGYNNYLNSAPQQSAPAPPLAGGGNAVQNAAGMIGSGGGWNGRQAPAPQPQNQQPEIMGGGGGWNRGQPAPPQPLPPPPNRVTGNSQYGGPPPQSWQSANPGSGNIPPELIQMLMNRFGGAVGQMFGWGGQGR